MLNRKQGQSFETWNMCTSLHLCACYMYMYVYAHRYIFLRAMSMYWGLPAFPRARLLSSSPLTYFVMSITDIGGSADLARPLCIQYNTRTKPHTLALTYFAVYSNLESLSKSCEGNFEAQNSKPTPYGASTFGLRSMPHVPIWTAQSSRHRHRETISSRQ